MRTLVLPGISEVGLLARLARATSGRCAICDRYLAYKGVGRPRRYCARPECEAIHRSAYLVDRRAGRRQRPIQLRIAGT